VLPPARGRCGGSNTRQRRSRYGPQGITNEVRLKPDTTYADSSRSR